MNKCIKYKKEMNKQINFIETIKRFKNTTILIEKYVIDRKLKD